MKKWIPVLMTASLFASVATACGAKKEPASSGAGTPEPTVSAAPVKKTFTALLDSNPTFPYSKEWPIWDMIEEKTGVRLDVQVPSGKLADTLNVTMASGSLPDLLFMANRNDSNRFGMQGALANILDYVNQMPNLKKWMDKYPEEAKATVASDGKMYMFPNQGFGETNRMIWMYREDIFKKNNLTPPKTFDELYTVLKKLKDLYPDSYPLSIRFGQIPDEMMINLTTNFGIGNDVFYDYDKKQWKYSPTDPNYKTLLETMQKFVKEKLIPPDFLTMQTKQWQDMMSNSKAFITIDYISRIDFFNSAMKKENPEYNLQFMSPPAGVPGGKQLNPYMHYLESGLTVSAKSKNIKDIMKYMDFFYTDEGRTITSWGKEGVTYTVENGKKKFKADYADATDVRKKTGILTNGAYTWIDFDSQISLFSKDLQNAYQEARKYDPAAMQPRPAFNEKENELLSVTGQAVKKKREENFSKFATGNRSLSEWDTYVQEMNNLGVQKLLDTYTEANKRTDSTQLNK